MARWAYGFMAVDDEEGVKLTQSLAPDLILMNMSLPGLGKWEASQRIKTRAQTQAIGIIALTPMP